MSALSEREFVSQIGRLRFIWNGFGGAPGLTTFYFSGASTSTFTATDASQARVAAEAFFTAIKANVAAGVSIASDGVCDVIDPQTGITVGSVSPGAPVGVNGSGAASMAPLQAAACVSWLTGVGVGRRLLRGRTFLSPLTAASWGPDGRLAAAAVTSITNAANAFVADVNSQPVIWHRPNPLKTGNNGSASPIITVKLNQNGAVLRSRRQ